MINFILGILTGILISLFLLLLEAFLWVKGASLGEKLVKPLKKLVTPPGAILMPDNLSEEIIKVAQEKGEDLDITEL